MAKVVILEDKVLDKVSLKTTSAREKIWLREFEEQYLHENDDVTAVEMLQAKRSALVQFRQSASSNKKCAADCACKMLNDAH